MAEEPEPDETETDEVNEQDTLSTEAAIALVIAGMLMARGGDESDGPHFWFPFLKAGAGLVLTQFLLRTGARLLGAPSAHFRPGSTDVRRTALATSDEAVSRASQALAGDRAALRVAAPMGGMADRAQTDAEVVSRMIVGPAREDLRYQIATNGGAVYKVWHTRRDSRVRLTHGGLEGNRVPIGNSFIAVNGDEIRFPGDPLAPIAETANCRCRLSYLVPGVSK